MDQLTSGSLIFLTILGTSGCSKKEKKSLRTDKPNIIILLTDDQGYGDMHCYGNNDLQTPYLDKMAAEGVRFTNFYAGAPSSTPSRAALMTGRYAERTGLSKVIDDNSATGLNSSEYTIADYLKQNNYSTAMFGKWHLGCQPHFMPNQHGFSEYWGIPYSNDMWPFHPKPEHDYKALPLYHNETIIEYNPNVNSMTTRITENTVNYINHHKDEPFFLYVAYTQPHVPLGVSDKFKGKSGKGVYADVIMEIDWSVGQIMETLKKNGIEDNTIIIFTSDNGPWLTYGNHGGSNGGLREGKGTTFEGGQRVPFIVRMPNTIPANQVSDQFISALDIMPTLLNLTHTSMPKMNPLDGQDVWDAFLCKDIHHKPFFFVNNGNVEAVRDSKWKVVMPHKYRVVLQPGKDGLPGIQDNKGRETELALYDLVNDPKETRNLADKNRKIMEKLTLAVDSIQKELSLTKSDNN